MRYFWPSFKAIFLKDIMIELRAKQVLPTMIVLGMLIACILRIATEAISTSTGVVAAASLWIAFLFSGLIAQERSFSSEHEQNCIDGLLLAPVEAGTIFLAKLLVNVVMLCVFEIIIVPVILLLFQANLSGRLWSLIVVLLLGNVGLSCIGTLFAAMVHLSRTRGALLSVVVLVVLLPMMIPATFAMLVAFGAIPAEVKGSGTLAFVGSYGAAVGYMVSFDAIFVVLCWLLFGFVVKE